MLSGLVLAAALGSGVIVGFSLGLIGAGSILAVPLLLYVVGEGDPHRAIGTGALAVSVNAYANLVTYARAGHVQWRSAAVFAVVGTAGAFAGSTIGKAVNGSHLLFLFGLLMLLVAGLMLRRRRGGEEPVARVDDLRTGVVALAAGVTSGFFGVGGGFLIVPGLMLATGMGMIDAVGSSLLSVGTFALATALNYAWSGLVDWPVAGVFIAAGVAGGLAGIRVARRLALRRDALTKVFAAVIAAVACYILYRSGAAVFG